VSRIFAEDEKRATEKRRTGIVVDALMVYVQERERQQLLIIIIMRSRKRVR